MLFEDYKEKLVPILKKKLGIKNFYALPHVKKVIVHMRLPEGKEDRGIVDKVIGDLALITGQKPKICRARKSVSDFKLTQGDPIGLQVTLRGKRKLDFLERLFNVVLPRLRDFRGLSLNAFDQGNNYNIGLTDHTVFPEINIDKVESARGLQITIVVDGGSQGKAKALLEEMNLPFKKEEK